MCLIHELEKSNYCMDANCNMPLCPECYIESHIGHKRGRIIDVYEDSKLRVQAALDSLEQNTREFEDKVKVTDEKINKIKGD